jgi:hypothetical protein
MGRLYDSETGHVKMFWMDTAEFGKVCGMAPGETPSDYSEQPREKSRASSQTETESRRGRARVEDAYAVLKDRPNLATADLAELLYGAATSADCNRVHALLRGPRRRGQVVASRIGGWLLVPPDSVPARKRPGSIRAIAPPPIPCGNRLAPLTPAACRRVRSWLDLSAGDFASLLNSTSAITLHRERRQIVTPSCHDDHVRALHACLVAGQPAAEILKLAELPRAFFLARLYALACRSDASPLPSPVTEQT